MTKDDMTALLMQIRQDLVRTQARLTEVVEAIAAMPWPAEEEVICPECFVRQRGPRTLAEHRYNVHDGPVPEHYLAAERAAGFIPD